MPVFKSTELQKILEDVLEASGASKEESEVVANLTVEAHLGGHDSHGTGSFVVYIRQILEGNIVPGAPLEVLKEDGAWLMLDGNWGFGQVIVSRATRMAIDKARASGTCTATIRHCNHLGRLASYLRTAAEEGMVSVFMANSHGQRGLVAPWGGIAPRLGTNPMGIGFPTGGDPFILDMTTCVAAAGKVALSHTKRESTPEGWLIDSGGNPTTNPDALFEDPPGSLLPLGGIAGHKGFGLGLAVEVLAGALSGAGCTQWESTRGGNAVFLMVASIETFLPLAQFRSEIQRLMDYVKSSPTTSDVEQIQIPGELEARHREKRVKEGILIDENTWQQLLTAADNVGLRWEPSRQALVQKSPS